MQTPDMPSSLLTPIGYRNNSCGYCNDKRSGSQSERSQKRFSYYASTTSLQPEFYECLLNRGWRRSGTLLYKPDQRVSCCPHYSIRLDSDAFHAIKDQRQTLNRFNKFILGDEYIREIAKLYPLTREQAKKRDTDFNLPERIHESETSYLKTNTVDVCVNLKKKKKELPKPAHTFSVTLEPDNFTEEKYDVFENYQRIVHNEPPRRISRSGFRSFLCSSPLSKRNEMFNGRTRSLGSYHQCYWIDGKLVAVGVLDLLPNCVSAVYFMYHNSVHVHGFGKIGALREISLAIEEGYRYWYAGFYIHNCVKMRYKADFNPQYVLDPESYSWDQLDDELKKLMEKRKFVSKSIERSIAEFGVDNSTKPYVAQKVPSTEEPLFLDPDIPLFDRAMPGILTKDKVLASGLDQAKILIKGNEYQMSDLVGWEESTIDSPQSTKMVVGELVAAVGTDLGSRMVVTFS